MSPEIFGYTGGRSTVRERKVTAVGQMADNSVDDIPVVVAESVDVLRQGVVTISPTASRLLGR